MKTLVVTGGIGSGKSYIVKIFSKLGIPSYNADLRTKALYQKPEVLSIVSDLFGEDIIANGQLDIIKLAGIVFNDAIALASLESKIYPLVLNDFLLWKEEQVRNSSAPFVIVESAIYLEKPMFHSLHDKVLAVNAPYELRLERAMARDAASENEILSRINKQWTDEQRTAHSDYVIVSDNHTPLLPQINKVYQDFLVS